MGLGQCWSRFKISDGLLHLHSKELKIRSAGEVGKLGREEAKSPRRNRGSNFFDVYI